MKIILWLLTVVFLGGLPGQSSGKEFALQCRGFEFDPWSGN